MLERRGLRKKQITTELGKWKKINSSFLPLRPLQEASHRRSRVQE